MDILHGPVYRDVFDELPKQDVVVLFGPIDDLLQLVLADHICVSLVGCQVDRQGDQFVPHCRLGEVDDQFNDLEDPMNHWVFYLIEKNEKMTSPKQSE